MVCASPEVLLQLGIPSLGLLPILVLTATTAALLPLALLQVHRILETEGAAGPAKDLATARRLHESLPLLLEVPNHVFYAVEGLLLRHLLRGCLLVLLLLLLLRRRRVDDLRVDVQRLSVLTFLASPVRARGPLAVFGGRRLGVAHFLP